LPHQGESSHKPFPRNFHIPKDFMSNSNQFKDLAPIPPKSMITKDHAKGV